MILINKLANFTDGTIVSLGNFDGVHLGHQKLLEELVLLSKELSLKSVAVIFDPHPCEYFAEKKNFLRLSSLREKIFFFKKLGINGVLCLKFTKILAELTPEQFIEKILIKKLNAKYIIVGEDYKFGKNRSGNIETLKIFFPNKVLAFGEIKINDIKVSSTEIRKLIQQHQILDANKLLGHPVTIIGRVTSGNGLGASWKVPTANIKLANWRLGLKGVYCALVDFNHKKYRAIVNIGNRPTITNINTNYKDNLQKKSLLLEAHLLEFTDNLYGKFVKVELLQWLRDEKKFTDQEELIAAIYQDLKRAKIFFKIVP